ncbi:MAG TPA: hypothetical protein VGB23_03665 [Nitrospirota bacterium]
MSSVKRKFDTLDQANKRQELLIGGRLRDKDRILAASKKADAIRKRLSAKLAPSDSAKIIRKSRDSR